MNLEEMEDNDNISIDDIIKYRSRGRRAKVPVSSRPPEFVIKIVKSVEEQLQQEQRQQQEQSEQNKLNEVTTPKDQQEPQQVTTGRMFLKSPGTKIIQYPLYLALKTPTSTVNHVKLSVIVTEEFQNEPVDCLIVSNTIDLDCKGDRDAYYCSKLSNNPESIEEVCKKFLKDCKHKLSELDVKMKREPRMDNGGVFFAKIPGRDHYMAHMFISDSILKVEKHILSTPRDIRSSSTTFTKKITQAIKNTLEVIDYNKCTSVAFCPMLSSNGIGQFSCHESNWLQAARTIFYNILDYCNNNKNTMNFFDFRFCVTTMEQGKELKKALDEDINDIVLSQDKFNDFKNSLPNEASKRSSILYRYSLPNSNYNASVQSLHSRNGSNSSIFKLKFIEKFSFSSLTANNKKEIDRKGTEENKLTEEEAAEKKNPVLYYINYDSLNFSIIENKDGIEYIEEADFDSADDPRMNYQPKQIKYATVTRLIEELTSHKSFDNRFMYAFLLTYRTFINPPDLLDALVNRYNTPPEKKDISRIEFAKFYDSTLAKIRMRVCQVLKKWIEDHFHDFSQDPVMVEKCYQFIDIMKRTKGQIYATQIDNTLKKKLKNFENQTKNQASLNHEHQNNKEKEKENPLNEIKDGKQEKEHEKKEGTSKDEKPYQDLLVIYIDNPMHLARQLTLIEYEMFSKVKEIELINKSFSKANRETLAPNIYQLTEWFNRISNFVASRVLMESDIENRKTIMEFTINWAYEMLQLNNFNGVFEICGALQSSAIFRLKKTWACIDLSVKQKFAEMMKVISSDYNFSNFRKSLSLAQLPCLPYIGIYLTDLTFIEEGNLDELNGMINFIKRRKIAGVISDLKVFQQTPYRDIEYDEETQAFLRNVKPHFLEREMYHRSLILEPKEKKTEQNT